MKRFLTGGIAFVLVLTFVVSGSLVAQEEVNKKLLKIELPSLKIRKPACCDTDAEKAVCEICSSKKTGAFAALKSISLKNACEDCTRKEKCAMCAAAADKKTVVKDKIAATTDKAKKTVGKLRDRVKEAVKRDKAEK